MDISQEHTLSGRFMWVDIQTLDTDIEHQARHVLGISDKEEDWQHIHDRFLEVCSSINNKENSSPEQVALLNKYLDAYNTLKNSFERMWPHSLVKWRMSFKERLTSVLSLIRNALIAAFSYDERQEISYTKWSSFSAEQEKIIDRLILTLDGVYDFNEDDDWGVIFAKD